MIFKAPSSDSETDYEVMDSDYSESSGEDYDDFAVDGYVKFLEPQVNTVSFVGC